MTEYIKREDLIKEMESVTNDVTCPIHIAAEIDQIIALIPADDVAEVKHGYWYITEYEYINCSECGHMHYTGMDSTAQAKQNLMDGEVPNYCPNCGARMDGEEE